MSYKSTRSKRSKKDPTPPSSSSSSSSDSSSNESSSDEESKEKKKKIAKLKKRLEELENDEKKDKKKKKHKSRELNRVPFDYNDLSTFNASHFQSINLGKAPYFDGTNYSKWAYDMKLHLFGLHPSLWEIVCVGVKNPKKLKMEPHTCMTTHLHDHLKSCQSRQVRKGLKQATLRMGIDADGKVCVEKYIFDQDVARKVL